MKQLEQARIFLGKARQDEVAVNELKGSSSVADEIVGFHCQQAAEKLLKALLSVLKVRVRKTHDLQELIDLAASAETPLPEDLEAVAAFNPYAAAFRYDFLPPGMALDREAALELLIRLRQWVEHRIPDDPQQNGPRPAAC